MKFSMNKTMIMDKIIHDGIEVDNSISIVDLINGCNDRYVEYNEILNYISEQIDIDFNIKSINFNYRTKYLGGCLFEVVLKEDDINKRASFNVFYKDGEVSYYPGYIDMRLSSDELVELKDKFFNNSGYMDLFKIVGEFIQTFCCTYKSSSVCNEYKIEIKTHAIPLA